VDGPPSAPRWSPEEIFRRGGRASDSTLLRALDELAGPLGADGLPGRRLVWATAAARVPAWAAIVARHGHYPRWQSRVGI